MIHKDVIRDLTYIAKYGADSIMIDQGSAKDILKLIAVFTKVADNERNNSLK